MADMRTHIIGIFPINPRINFLRNVLDISEDDLFINYTICIDANIKILIQQDMFIRKLLLNKNIFYYTNYAQVINLLKQLHSCTVILTTGPHKKTYDLFNLGLPTVSVYYIHHGIICSSKAEDKVNNRLWSKKIKYLVASDHGKHYLGRNLFNVELMYALPQFENLMNQKSTVLAHMQTVRRKHRLSRKTKTVLLLSNPIYDRNIIKKTNRYVKSICAAIRKNIRHYHIFVKHKNACVQAQYKATDKNITVIDSTFSPYYYLGCDIVIMQGYSTLVIESLLVNDRSIVFNTGKSDPNIFYNLKKFPQLLFTKSFANLGTFIKRLANENFTFSEQYHKQKKQFLDLYAKNSNATEIVIDIIMKDKYQFTD